MLARSWLPITSFIGRSHTYTPSRYIIFHVVAHKTKFRGRAKIYAGGLEKEKTFLVTCFPRVFFLPWPNSRVPRRNYSFVQLLVQQLFLGTIDYFSLELLVESKLVIAEVYSITDDSDYNFLFLLKQFESTRKN